MGLALGLEASLHEIFGFLDDIRSLLSLFDRLGYVDIRKSLMDLLRIWQDRIQEGQVLRQLLVLHIHLLRRLPRMFHGIRHHHGNHIAVTVNLIFADDRPGGPGDFGPGVSHILVQQIIAAQSINVLGRNHLYNAGHFLRLGNINV